MTVYPFKGRARSKQRDVLILQNPRTQKDAFMGQAYSAIGEAYKVARTNPEFFDALDARQLIAMSTAIKEMSDYIAAYEENRRAADFHI